MKDLKKITGLFFGLLFAMLTLQAADVCAQPPKGEPKGRMAEFFEQKKAYLIREVGLTQKEADQFFPIYDELQKEKFKLHREVRDKIKQIQTSGKAISDAEYAEAARAINEQKVKEAKLDNDYYRKFEKILSPQKLYKWQMAETNFGKEMMKRGAWHGDRKGK